MDRAVLRALLMLGSSLLLMLLGGFCAALVCLLLPRLCLCALIYSSNCSSECFLVICIAPTM